MLPHKQVLVLQPTTCCKTCAEIAQAGTHRNAVLSAGLLNRPVPTLWLRPSSVRFMAAGGASASAALALVTYALLCTPWCSAMVALSMYCAAQHRIRVGYQRHCRVLAQAYSLCLTACAGGFIHAVA